jgi:hypothetical protein
MMVANTWTYNVMSTDMDSSLAGRGPAILSDRQGAWPRAVELAMRIRNLEFVMNRPAETSKICISGNTNITNCNKQITSIEQERKLGNERIVKAFYSGYRNLGNDSDVEMKQSFTLTELPPRKISYDNNANASVLLVPESKLSSYSKQWVDLKLMMVNYAIFYAAMIPRASGDTSGACDISKVAIPVPGYPLGFYKNPDVLTYYAVKGEAEFTGMFNPFVEDQVKLEAYSAAKPMGGRIGPMLFTQRPNEGFLIGRTDKLKYRSIPYITSYNFNGVTIRGKTYTEGGATNFIPGLPLPTNSKQAPGAFWLEAPNKPLGGKVPDANGIQFGVPNLVYDYEVPFKTTGYTLSDKAIHIIQASNQDVDPSEQAVGLFSKHQFKQFRGTALSNNISPTVLDQEIARVRAPTLYEAANYLVPTPNAEFNMKNELDSFGFITGEAAPKDKGDGIQTIDAKIYAPLFKDNDQSDVLYDNSAEVVTAINQYMISQRTGMQKYLMSMNRAAMNIWAQRENVAGGAEGSKSGYERAATGVSNIANMTGGDLTQIPKSCDSLAGQFMYFYYGQLQSDLAPPDSPGCPTPLSSLIGKYFNKSSLDAGYNPTYYTMVYSYNTKVNNMQLMTAYAPGPFTGAGMDGTFVSPISGDIRDKMRRNFYSTKFVTLDSLQTTTSGGNYADTGFPIMSEGDANRGDENVRPTSFANSIETSEDLSSIKY